MRDRFLPLLLVLTLSAGSGFCAQLESVFQDDKHQFTGVAVSKSGRTFLSYPRWDQNNHQYDVVELFPDGSTKPFPNEGWNSWKPGEDSHNKWVCAQALAMDDEGFLWVVDPASPEFAGVVPDGNKLVKIDLNTNSIARVYPLSPAADAKSYANDVRVDTKRQVAYLTNSSQGGIIIVDLKSGKVRQVLQDSPSVKSDPNYQMTVDGKPLVSAKGPVKIHSDGLALTQDESWLYYKSLTDPKLYRIKTDYLLDENLPPADLAAKVEDLGSFCTTDGMIRDRKGNIYLGDIEKNSIVRLTPELKLEPIFQDKRLSWPDSYAISDDGVLYITCSQIQKAPRFNGGKDTRTTPYTLYRLKINGV